MRKNGLKLGAACAALMLAMTGCGNQIPDLTEEEMQMVGEYAAITLLKYDANHRSRLVDTALVETEEVQADEEDVKEPVQEETEEISESKPEEMPESAPMEELPVVDAVDMPIPAEEAEVETFYELPQNLKIAYTGYKVCSSYPADAEGAYLTLDAEQGKKLLVLQFEIKNETGAEQAVDLFSSTAIYHVTVNGIHEQNALTTMLMNDMSTLVTSIPAGDSQEAVLVVEMEESITDSISSITLQMKNEPKTYTIQLL